MLDNEPTGAGKADAPSTETSATASGGDASGTTSGGRGAAPRRRRTASRPAGPPVNAEPSEDAEPSAGRAQSPARVTSGEGVPSAETGSSIEGDAAASAGPPARKRVSRTRKASASAAAAEGITTSASPDSAVDTAVSTASSSTSASTAAVSPDEVTDTVTDGGPAATSGRPTRKRASRKSASTAPSAAPEEASASSSSDVLALDVLAADAEFAVVGPEADEEGLAAAQAIGNAASGDDGPTPAFGAPGVLFQPPSSPGTRAPRRRRASAAAGAPVSADDSAADLGGVDLIEDLAAGDLSGTDLAGPGLGDDLDASDAAGAEDDTEDAEESSGSRRRRRGGRGRRGRGRGRDDEGDSGDSEAGGSAGSREPAVGGIDVGGLDAYVTAADSEGDGKDADFGDSAEDTGDAGDTAEGETGTRRRRRRRRRGGETGEAGEAETEPETGDDPPRTVTRVREPRKSTRSRAERSDRGDTDDDGVRSIKGSTRLEAKKQRRREGRDAGRRRPSVITEAEFLARRESVDRVMIVRQNGERTQIAVLEDGVLVEHYVSTASSSELVGNVYLGKVQNVLPSMEAAFVDMGKGRNAVLYAGEVNWDAAGLDGQPRRIELAMKSGDPVLVQVTKDPIGHKGARLTSQISLAGRYLVLVPGGSMTGISRKLPDTERSRLKAILRQVVPEGSGVIVRTAAEGASEDELSRDVARLTAQWEDIEKKAAKGSSAPTLLYGEPDMTIRVVRDIFNEDFASLVVSGDEAWEVLDAYVGHVAPDLRERMSRWTSEQDVFTEHRVDEQLAKALDRKVWLPSGGYLIIDRTEAMIVVDVNTGKFTGAGGNLEETVTKNNLEAAEELIRQLRLRDLGGMIVVDFIDMVLESNRDLVLRRLMECLGRDRTKHQVAEVTSLGLVQMTRKRVGQGLHEVFAETCESCNGRGYHIHTEPLEKQSVGGRDGGGRDGGGRDGGPQTGRENGRDGGREAGSERKSGRGGRGRGGSSDSPVAETVPAAPAGPSEAAKAASVLAGAAASRRAAAEAPAAAQDPVEPSVPEDHSSAPVAEPTTEDQAEPQAEPVVKAPRRRRKAVSPVTTLS